MIKKVKVLQQSTFGACQAHKECVFLKGSDIVKSDIEDFYVTTSEIEYNFNLDSIDEILEECFSMYNHMSSELGHKWYSMSVGDIVVIDGKYYLVCSIGFEEIESLRGE